MNLKLALATLLLVGSFVVFTFGTVPQLNFPYALNYGEGVLLDQARRVSESPGLYPAFDAAPYVIDNYPPLYPFLVGVLPAPDTAPFFTARLISLLSALVSAWVLALLVRKWSSDAAALVAAAVFLSLPQINDFAEVARIDSLALALGLIGMYGVLHGRLRWRWIGCAAFFLSIYTRHSSLALPLATFLILFRQEGRRALTWPFGLLAAGAAAYAVLHLMTGGRIYEHLLHFNVLDYVWMKDPLAAKGAGTVDKWFAGFYPVGYLLIVAAFLGLLPLSQSGSLRWRAPELLVATCLVIAVGFMIPVYFKSIQLGVMGVPDTHFLPGGKIRPGWNLYHHLIAFHACMFLAACVSLWRWWRRPDQPFGVFVLFGFASAAMIGRAGSDTNYLFDISAMLTLVAACALERGPRWSRAIVAVGLAVTVVFNIYLLEWSSGGEGVRDSRPRRLLELRTAHGKLVKALAGVEGPILSDNPAVVALLGKPMIYQPFMYRELRQAEVWDPSSLHQSIREQEFDAVVISAVSVLLDPTDPKKGVGWVASPDTYTNDTREWIRRHYEFGGVRAQELITGITLRRWEVWVRRPR